jgi:hypothetical protein
LETSKAASIDTTAIQTEAIAMCRPGHNL